MISLVSNACLLYTSHLRLDDYERICRDYRMLWKEYDEYKLINGNGYENEKVLS